MNEKVSLWSLTAGMKNTRFPTSTVIRKKTTSSYDSLSRDLMLADKLRESELALLGSHTFNTSDQKKAIISYLERPAICHDKSKAFVADHVYRLQLADVFVCGSCVIIVSCNGRSRHAHAGDKIEAIDCRLLREDDEGYIYLARDVIIGSYKCFVRK